MIIKNEIELQQPSIDYLKFVFEQYKEVDKLDSLVTNPIIHIYPKEDTYDANGELNGYNDALFCEIHIYDATKMTVWKSKRLHDGVIPYDELKISQIKIFKDLSTIICLRGNYRISCGTAISIGK